MNRSYSDITNKLGEPLWWDEQCVPRYDEFHPRLLDIYAEEAVLAEIQCQFCRCAFHVAFTDTQYELSAYADGQEPESLASRIIHESLGFGDPPRSDKCCMAGSTATSDFMRVLQYWKKDKNDWIRHREFEVEFANRESEMQF